VLARQLHASTRCASATTARPAASETADSARRPPENLTIKPIQRFEPAHGFMEVPPFRQPHWRPPLRVEIVNHSLYPRTSFRRGSQNFTVVRRS
jgi:hypothetical protein